MAKYNGPRYRKVIPKFWDTTKRWNDTQRFGALYLLTCRHANAIGCYVLPKGYIAEDLGWTTVKVQHLFDFLKQEDFIDYDPNNNLMLIHKFLIYNPLDNKNQAKAAAKLVFDLPKSPLLLKLASYVENVGNIKLEPFLSALQQVTNGLPNGLPNRSETVSLTYPEGYGKPGAGTGAGTGYRTGDGYGSKKRTHGEFVKLTDKEYQSLIDKIGQPLTEQYIEQLNLYVGSKGDKYKSHYYTILSWVNKDQKDNKGLLNSSTQEALECKQAYLKQGVTCVNYRNGEKKYDYCIHCSW